jgi:hypothetical protein
MKIEAEHPNTVARRSRCNVCGGNLKSVFEVRILGDVSTQLYRCVNCQCSFFVDPIWLDRAYSLPISKLDTGISQRADDITNILTCFLLAKSGDSSGLDFGGGIGLLSRKLRDRGFCWFSSDPKTSSVFPQPELPTDGRFGVVSLIEVLEHLVEPLETLRELSLRTDQIFISTLLIPKLEIEETWWYLQLETGQHIFFLSHLGLLKLGTDLNMKVYTNGHNLHVLSHNRISFLQLCTIKFQKITWVVGWLLGGVRRSRSLSHSDYFQALGQVDNS